MREGDEECHICRDDIPATIAFVPCKHKVCFGCMENMRAKNIFKVSPAAADGLGYLCGTLECNLTPTLRCGATSPSVLPAAVRPATYHG
jgi:hypothetical protein